MLRSPPQTCRTRIKASAEYANNLSDIETDKKTVLFCQPAGSYLAHVKLQTPHVPLDGFDLLQTDRNGTRICWSSLEHGHMWFIAVSVMIGASVLQDVMRQSSTLRLRLNCK